MRLRTGVALLCFLMFSACTVPDDNAVPDDKVTPPALPAKVTGLTAYVDGGNVRLTWNAQANADGYRVYRKLTGPAKAILVRQWKALRYGASAGSGGEKIADVETALHVDAPQPGNTYSYTVLAYNALGEGPASSAATANLFVPPPLVDPFAAYVHAPFDPTLGNEEEEDDSFVAPVVIEGGDAGVTSATDFAEAAFYASCVSYGAEVRSIRPALGSPLPLSDQTFAVTFAYNVSEETDIVLYLVADWPEDSHVIALESETLFSGCGTRAFSYTVDMGVYPKGTSVMMGILSSSGVDFYDFPWKDTPRLEIVESAPKPGGALHGDSPLRVSVAYAMLPTGTVNLSLQLGASEIANAVTAVSGTGSFAIDVPYPAVCGSSARLRVSMRENDTMVAQTYTDYKVDVTGAVRFRIPQGQRFINLTGYDNLWRRLDVASCDGQERNVTLATSFGKLEMYGSSYGNGARLSGTTGNSWYLDVDSSDLPGEGFGTYPLTITLSTEGIAPLAVTLDVTAYGLYWKTRPPEEAEGTASFPIEVTGVNVAADAELWVEVYGIPNKIEPLIWNGSAFAGMVSAGSCGWQDFSVEGRIGSEFLYGPWGSTHVLSSPVYGLWLSDSWIYFGSGEPADQEVRIYEACDRPVTWEVISAPPWLRFSALSGSSATALHMVLDQAAVEEAGPWDSGEVYIRRQGGSEFAVLHVSYDVY